MQPETVCILILLSLLYLFSFFIIFLREEDVVVDVVAVSSNWRWNH